MSLPIVDLEEYEIRLDNFVAQGAVTLEDGLRELRNRIQTDHLNDLERRAIMNICGYYNDIVNCVVLFVCCILVNCVVLCIVCV